MLQNLFVRVREDGSKQFQYVQTKEVNIGIS